MWSALPLFHVTALGIATWILGKGATFYSDYSFDAARTVATLRDEKITQFYPAYQPVTEAVLAHPDFDKADLSAIKTWANVAPPEVLEKFQNAAAARRPAHGLRRDRGRLRARSRAATTRSRRA